MTLPRATNQSSSVQAIWDTLVSRLRGDFGEATYQSWLKHLALSEVSGGEVVLTVPTRFIREWINNNYLSKITALWRQQDTSILRVRLIVGKQSVVKKDAEAVIASGSDVSGQNVDILNADQGMQLGSPLDRRFTFDNFVAGGSNDLALAAAKSIAEAEGVVPGNNPLYVYGGVGLGKTHLLHAIAWKMSEADPQRSVVYLSAERFMYLYVQSLRNKEIMSFKERFRSVDVLIIDDVQFICGKESTQEEFYHTCNALLDRKKQLIISGDRSPADLDGMKERIRSRLGWGLVVDVNPASYGLRLGILQSKVSQMRDIPVPGDVLEFLATKITSNTRELEGALNKVIAHSTLMKKPVELNSTQMILSDLLRANEKVITIADIQKLVADHYAIKLSDMTSSRRSRSVARPRQIAMCLCKHHTLRSLSEIGRRFGGKDHTTVMHAVKKIESLCRQDAEFKEEVLALEWRLFQ